MADRYEHAVVRLLPVCHTQKDLEEKENVENEVSVYRPTSSMTWPLENGIQASLHLDGREQQIKILHESLKKVVELLPNCALSPFVVKTRDSVECNWVSLLIMSTLECG